MKNEKLRDIHILIEEEDLNRIKKLCTHKGDLTWHLQQAVKSYLIVKEEKAKTPTQKQKLTSISGELKFRPEELMEFKEWKQKREAEMSLLEKLRRPKNGSRGAGKVTNN